MKRFAWLMLALSLAASPCYAGMGRNILKGAADQTTYIRIVSATDGTPETGVTSATSGLDLEYVRLGAAPTDLTESDLAATNSAHSDGGIKHMGGGVYRVDLPDAAVASGVDQVSVQGTCTGMVVLGVTHQLVDMSLSGQSATYLKDFADAGYDPTTNTITGIFGTINDFDELLSGSDDFDTAFQASATTFFGATGGNLTSLASQSSVNTIDDLLDTEVAAIKTKTDYLPSATAGAAGGVLVAGSNAATTFTTLTSTGAFSINGTSMVAQTGDSFARIGSNGGSLTSLATASAQTSQGSILNKLDASFASSGVFSTGALANAPTGTGEGGGLTPEQEGWLEDAYDNSVSIKAKTDNLPSDPADASVLAGLIGSPLVTLAADIASSRTSLETKVDNIEIEAAGMLTDVNQDPVGASQLFLAVRKAGGLVGDEARTITVGTVPLLGVDFRNVAPTGRQITNAEDWEIVSGTAGGLTFGDVGRDKQMSKCSVTAVTPGTYRVRVRVTFYGGAIDTCVITIKVAAL